MDCVFRFWILKYLLHCMYEFSVWKAEGEKAEGEKSEGI